ncbi:MAG: hypothetical protein F7B60_02975 [Desulfurococcales archaeon]|nr:hypothetical protein [Desulfurococcales archaeon]
MSILEKGFYKIRGPGKLRLTGCNIDIMGITCSGECDFVIPTGRTYLFRVKGSKCTYMASPREAMVVEDDWGGLIYSIRDKIISILKESSHDGVVFIGPPDSFKSTISTLVFNTIFSAADHLEVRPCYITTDVGQNEIFMPTFISATILPVYPGIQVNNTINCFTGAISPAFNTEKYLWCITHLVGRLRSDRNFFIVDTDGWINSYKAIYSKMMIAELFDDPLIVYTGLDEEFKKYLYYHFNDITEYNIPKSIITNKTSSERRVHRARLVLRAFRDPCRIIIDCQKSMIAGLPIFHGSKTDISRFGVPTVIYAENWNGKIIAVLEDKFSYKLQDKDIEVLRKNWEQGLIAALYNKGEVREVGLVEKVDYRKKRLAIITNKGASFDYIEIGRTSFPGVLETLEHSLQ